MVIQCDKCDTRFRLPDERLKPEGVKVRCSHCKEVFTVYPPAAEAAPAAPPKSPPPAPPEPEPEPAAAGGDLDFDAAFSEEGGASDDGVSSQGMGDFDAPAGAEATEGGGEDFGFDFSDGVDEDAGQTPNEFAFDEGAWEEEAPAASSGAEEGGPSEFSFDDSTWEEESAAPEQPVVDDDEGGEEVGGGTKDEFSFDEEDWSESSDAGSSQESAGAGFDTDFGIEDNSAFDAPAPGPSGAGGGDFKFTEIAPAVAGSSDDSLGRGFEPDAGFDMEDEDLVSAVPEPPVRRQKKSSSSTLPLLLLLLLVLAGAGGFFLWQQGQLKFVDDLIAQIEGVGTIPETSRIEIKNLDHDFVENREAGSLFVIRGQAINRFSEKRSSLQVKGELFDAKGGTLARQVVYCGNPFSNEELASLPFAKIEEGMANQFGVALSNFEVPPGKGLPFVIVFRNVPKELAEYGVDVVGSQPVAQ